MSRVLLTGMSGTGKSSVIAELRSRGFTAIDMDEPGWSVRTAEGNHLISGVRTGSGLYSPSRTSTTCS
jgi:dephospho-CoA kinase